jgi:thymidine phosphorylase
MSTPDAAFDLARAMVDIGTAAGRAVVAVVTSMDQPLGYAIGNALEVEEAVQTLRGGGPEDLRELCLVLGSQLVRLARGTADDRGARSELDALLRSGAALAKFRDLVTAQGGDGTVADSPALVLPKAAHSAAVTAPLAGYIARIDAMLLGEAARVLGAGRQKKDDHIDPAAGICLVLKAGENISAGQPWASVYAPDPVRLKAGVEMLRGSITITPDKPETPPLIYGFVDRDGRETRLY